MSTRHLEVRKTRKLYVAGQFVRSASGRVLAARPPKGGLLDNDCWASRKDARDAVVAARAAFEGWAKCTAYLRGAARLLSPAEWFGSRAEDPYWILDTVEFKTAWHPIGV